MLSNYALCEIAELVLREASLETLRLEKRLEIEGLMKESALASEQVVLLRNQMPTINQELEELKLQHGRTATAKMQLEKDVRALESELIRERGRLQLAQASRARLAGESLVQFPQQMHECGCAAATGLGTPQLGYAARRSNLDSIGEPSPIGVAPCAAAVCVALGFL